MLILQKKKYLNESTASPRSVYHCMYIWHIFPENFGMTVSENLPPFIVDAVVTIENKKKKKETQT